MAAPVPYFLALVLVLAASLAVLGQNTTDPCVLVNTCQACVVTKTNTSEAKGTGNGTCVWEVTSSGQQCVLLFNPSQEVQSVAFTLDGCAHILTTTTAAPPTTTNGTTVPTTSTTPPPTTSTNGTTTTAAPTTSTNGTTTTPPPTPSTNGTTTTPTPTPTTHGTSTTPVPSNSTTTAKPTPAPASGGFSWASFIGGIVFAAALSSVAYLIFRFYKVRLGNYHTFSNPTF